MKQLIVAMSLLCCLAACKQPLPYQTFEQDVYDIPVKTQYSQRIAEGDSLNKEQLSELLYSLYDRAAQGSYKYHNPPTHIFIYAYRSEADFQKSGSAWVGMISTERGSWERKLELKQP